LRHGRTRSVDSDILVVGAGPAGLAAAIEASEHGATVSIVDENARPGGQLLKQTHRFFGSERHQAGTRGIDIGSRLVATARDRNVDLILDTPVIGIFNGLVVAVNDNRHFLSTRPRRIILATGAAENAISFPGWSLPGVITAGAAQTFVNVHRIRVGENIVVVGSGNVGLIVAYQLMQAGSNVVAIVEAMGQVGGWGVHAAKIRRMGIPILTRHTITEAAGDTHVEQITVHEVDDRLNRLPGSEKALEADTVCLAVGMSPRSHLAEMADCAFTDVPELGGTIPIHNAIMQTSIRSIYCAGDVSGVEEASTAIEEGRLAGLGAAFSLDLVESDLYERRAAICMKALDDLRSGPFGQQRKTGKDAVLREYDEYYKNR